MFWWKNTEILQNKTREFTKKNCSFSSSLSPDVNISSFLAEVKGKNVDVTEEKKRVIIYDRRMILDEKPGS